MSKGKIIMYYWWRNITFKVISAEAQQRCLLPYKVMFIGVSMHFIVLQIFSATIISPTDPECMNKGLPAINTKKNILMIFLHIVSITYIWKDFIRTKICLISYLKKTLFSSAGLPVRIIGNDQCYM